MREIAGRASICWQADDNSVSLGNLQFAVCRLWYWGKFPFGLSGTELGFNHSGKIMKSRHNVINLINIPNVGVATSKYLNIVGINRPAELIGQNPYSLFAELCQKTGKQFDPCLADVFISAVKFMEGGPERKWWYYTAERKNKLGRQKK